jgi:hypothetical protein
MKSMPHSIFARRTVEIPRPSGALRKRTSFMQTHPSTMVNRKFVRAVHRTGEMLEIELKSRPERVKVSTANHHPFRTMRASGRQLRKRKVLGSRRAQNGKPAAPQRRYSVMKTAAEVSYAPLARHQVPVAVQPRQGARFSV